MEDDIRFVLFVLAPVSLIVVPLLRAHRRARRSGPSAAQPSSADASADGKAAEPETSHRDQ